MTQGSAVLAIGVQLAYDGDPVEVVEFDGSQVTVKVLRTNDFRIVWIGRLVSGCRTIEESIADDLPNGVGMTLAALTPRQRAEVAERAGYVREVMTGFRGGHQSLALPG
jgi:hypothetical protein